ncbi:Tyrosine-protein phosphatase Lar [Chionoecetes opilio]|uniref:Tyrosine-protein phosphatase Lar n=1 Tax=Chionoecetes opilio TaxID=41210 RepID=A0A8J5CP89_CHIOP|nr:Tyrosine-protein phosphatase Lar [Chionoecetes opilio]
MAATLITCAKFKQNQSCDFFVSFSQLTGRQRTVVELNVCSPAPAKLLAAWTSESSEISHFEVTWSPPAEDATRSATATNTSYAIDALTPHTRYAVSVRVEGDTNQTLGFSDNVEAITASPATTVPGPPANVTARATGCRTLWVGWEEPDEPKGVMTGYTVIWTHAATNTADTLQVDGNTTATIVLGLQPCTAYSITVSATNGAGSGLQGGPAIATTESAAPASPANLNVSQVDGRPDAPTVTRTKAAALGYCNITSNTITRWLAAAGHLIGNKTFPATVQVKLTGLQPATTYSMDVSAAVHDTMGPRAGCINGTTGE